MYAPGSEARRLNREAALLLGAGPRALLLQVAHPLVAEGVAQHSDFQADPWARLAGTVRSYLRIVYGRSATAREEIRRLNALHRAVAGPVRDPVVAAAAGAARYSARDPELALWVHATLVDATIVVVDAWQEPLGRARRARYYAETRPIGRALGIPESLLPPDIEAFDAYVARMLSDDGPVHPSATSRELAAVILHPPLRPLLEGGPLALRLGRLSPAASRLADVVPTAAWDWTLLPAVGLLPAQTRREYRLPWGPAERAAAWWLTRCWGFARPWFPESLRIFPQARAAERAASQSSEGNRAA